jgi:hypothetical protein
MIFGRSPIEPKVLLRKLVSELARRVQRQGKKAHFTGNLKAVLRQMGKKRRHVVNPDKAEPRQFVASLQPTAAVS